MSGSGSSSTQTSQPAASESQPLLGFGSGVMSSMSVSRLWLGAIVALLAAAWCVLDSWNRALSITLFSLPEVNPLSPGHMQTFNYTLTLAFLQFFFMGAVFLALGGLQVNAQAKSFASELQKLLVDRRGQGLVATHALSSVLMQSAIMPKQMMSLGVFAATRAVEVPTAAVLRSKILDVPRGGHPVATTALMFAAVWTMFYAYTEIAECLCVWTGFGVAIAGPALFLVYALLLTLPATNIVLQEAVLVQLKTPMLLMLGVQNMGACILVIPVLQLAHVVGFEDIQEATAMIVGSGRISMAILWLSIQMGTIAVVSVGLIYAVDSFWTVSLRSLRVVFWWCGQLIAFYMSSQVLLSVAKPAASFWSFIMLCGLGMVVLAVVKDVETEEAPEVKTGTSGNLKYV